MIRVVIGSALLVILVARADGDVPATPFVELDGGPTLPLGLDVSADWTPLSLTYLDDYEVNGLSAQRFRALGHIFVSHQNGPGARFELRLGAGVDIIRYAYGIPHFDPSETRIISITPTHVTSSGLMVEAGAGWWWRIAKHLDAGGHLDVPIAFQRAENTPLLPFDSYELDLLVGIRAR